MKLKKIVVKKIKKYFFKLNFSLINNKKLIKIWNKLKVNYNVLMKSIHKILSLIKKRK